MEFVGVLPLVALTGVLIVQAALMAVSVMIVQHSAVAASHQQAPASAWAAARAATPRPWRRGLTVEQSSRGTRVQVQSPRVVPVASRWLTVSTSVAPR